MFLSWQGEGVATPPGRTATLRRDGDFSTTLTTLGATSNPWEQTTLVTGRNYFSGIPLAVTPSSSADSYTFDIFFFILLIHTFCFASHSLCYYETPGRRRREQLDPDHGFSAPDAVDIFLWHGSSHGYHQHLAQSAGGIRAALATRSFIRRIERTHSQFATAATVSQSGTNPPPLAWEYFQFSSLSPRMMTTRSCGVWAFLCCEDTGTKPHAVRFCCAESDQQ